MTSHIKEKIVITEIGGYTRRNTLKNFIPNLFRKIFSILNKNKISPSNMKFLPRYGRVASKWWNYSPDAIIEMIKLLGFGKSTVNYHYYLDKNGKKVFQFTVVGERTVPMDKCDYQYDAN